MLLQQPRLHLQKPQLHLRKPQWLPATRKQSHRRLRPSIPGLVNFRLLPCRLMIHRPSTIAILWAALPSVVTKALAAWWAIEKLVAR